ncbi:type I iterative polyketide synthase [Penicillium canariense]|uniref:Type I iterative polyketide synthase n=1 Tax=Penicillium canariense TaxID=189055 RepID=A0A9W9I6J0_9EURO|nr:type I iterative polyketide synthase [Penicillium canariense]KAJ5166627.1 type I iterative polyketide synthase [Penicillium canariense]
MNGAVAPNGTQCDGESQPPQPIAIIGYACRLAGQVSSPSDLWELCTRARSGWSPIPKDRFSHGAYHHPNPSKPGTFNPAGGYFLDEDISRFDAPFFNVTVQEAISMDPQQRLLLECSYEALESAGIPKESLAGRNVGVFVGGNFSDYELNNLRDIETLPSFQATGNAPALQSNRISYYFDLEGPSMTIDTACSSSLVALHYAVQSIRSGESKEALVGGCRLNLLPDYFVSMSMSQLFNDDGKTYSFDERAKSGFARGEGAGVVLLKPLDAALRDKDPIRAVIANSGVNQDGRTKGITLPNEHAQEKLIRRVYREANLNPDECGFAEMHGTGTKAGDPIEARAVQAALGGGRTARNPLYIGSVKSNVGHLEGASGIASIIKTAMILDKGLLLPNADFKKPNPNIPLAEWNMKVVTSTRPFPRGMKYASVSNYGFGGTNAHVVLQRPPMPEQSEDDAGVEGDPKSRLFLISANDKEALRARIQDFGIYFEQRPEVFENSLFGNFAHTLGTKLSHLSYRVALSAVSLDDLGIKMAQLKVNPIRVLGAPTVAFVFTGQGAQWAQMGIPLMGEYPIFAAAIERADRCLLDLGADFSLLEELQKDAAVSEINAPHLSQPACTALQIALTDLLRSWGIRPSSVVGHSSGEIGAAYAAGIYDLEGAMALAYRRGQMTSLLKSSYPQLKGTMIAVGASPEAIKPMLKTLGSYATVACVNSPSSVTVSGDADAIDELEAVLQEKQLFNRKLKIGVAYHSDHMKKVAEAYLAAIDSILPSSSTTATFFSSVTGEIAEPSDLGPAYWVANLTSPVLFADALAKMCTLEENRPNLLLELGPHSALKGPILDTMKSLGSTASKIGYAATVLRNADPAQSMLNAAGAVYVRGGTLNITAINFPVSGGRNRSFLRDLPKYPWQHGTRYWHEARIAENHKFRDGKRNDMLGTLAIYSNDLEPTWRNIVRLDDIPWLREHKMQGMNVYPMAGYLAMAIEAARRRAEQHEISFSQFEFREVTVGAALVLTDDVDAETTISLKPYAEGTRGNSDIWDEFRISSWTSKRGWTVHCSGLVRTRANNKQQTLVVNVAEAEEKHFHSQINRVKEQATYKIDTQNMYQVLTDVGAGYGPLFQGLENVFSSPVHSCADLYVRDTKTVMPKNFEAPLTIHPTFLDALLHLVWPILGQGRMALETLYMPTMIKNLVISDKIPSVPGEFVKAWCNGGPSQASPEPTKFDLWVTPQQSTEVLINMEGLVMTPLKDTGAIRRENTRNLCYKFEWKSLADVEKGLTPEIQESSDHVNGINGHAEEPTSALANGHATSELPNGHTDSHLTLDKMPHINGNGIMNGHHLTDVLITQFGESDGIADKLNDAIRKENIDWKPSVSDFGEMDATGKRVVVLHTGAHSLRDLTAQSFEDMKRTLLNASHVLWVYRLDNPDAQMIVGLTRSLRSETLAKVATLGLETEDLEKPAIPITAAMNAIWPADSVKPCNEFEFRAKGAELYVPRAFPDDAADTFVNNETHEMTISSQPFHQPGRRFKLQIGNLGALDTLYFADDVVDPLADDEIEFEVKATGLNFKDIVVTMGQLAQPYIGIECSGIVSSVGKNVKHLTVGQRVMALPLGGYSTYARCKATSAALIPENMSFEVAATVPVVFCTAYYALFDLGHLQEGERILIHAGAGGVGQAAIMLAQMIGAEIFVTVGSVEKRQFLMAEYGIAEDHILYSRDSSFGRGIRRATNNEGVDVVVNSLAGDLLRETWECLAPFGRFIEIGKADITKNTRLDMLPFEYNITFASVDLTKVAARRPKLMKRLLDDVTALMTKGSVHPALPLTTYRISDLEIAFRTLQTGKAMGKIVVVPHQDDHVKAVTPKTGSSLLKADASYILIGGTGGLGQSMARWMSSKGAGHIVLVSRSASVNDQVRALIDELAVNGTHVTVKPCDVSSRQSVENLVKGDMKDLPPVRGVVHGAMVLRDMLFENMTLDDFQAVITSKVDGAWNLHEVLADSPLDFFVALSSVAGVIGNRGQAAYAAANVFLDGFMEYRRSQGLPGTSIDLTAVRDVGYLAEVDSKRRQEVLNNIGTDGMDEAEVLALLAAAITGDLVESCSGQFIVGLELSTLDHFWAQDAKFSVLYEAAKAAHGSGAGGSGPSAPLNVLLANAASKEEALRICYEALAAKLAQILVISLEDMDPSITVASLGLDSLVAIEIRNWIAREANANVQVLELLSSGSLMALAEIILNKSQV